MWNGSNQGMKLHVFQVSESNEVSGGSQADSDTGTVCNLVLHGSQWSRIALDLTANIDLSIPWCSLLNPLVASDSKETARISVHLSEGLERWLLGIRVVVFHGEYTERVERFDPKSDKSGCTPSSYRAPRKSKAATSRDALDVARGQGPGALMFHGNVYDAEDTQVAQVFHVRRAHRKDRTTEVCTEIREDRVKDDCTRRACRARWRDSGA
ncbi:hypothetical protein B0H11DRAFT_1900160 [Mycena galericulata]|nr:hypothetical protein B0H11DRAFT_1900160 [Mycena galericulata]